MFRKDTLTILRDIIKLLSDKKEYSIKKIAYKINSHWQTTIKALEFLKEIKIVRERLESGKRKSRLFSLVSGQ